MEYLYIDVFNVPDIKEKERRNVEYCIAYLLSHAKMKKEEPFGIGGTELGESSSSPASASTIISCNI